MIKFGSTIRLPDGREGICVGRIEWQKGYGKNSVCVCMPEEGIDDKKSEVIYATNESIFVVSESAQYPAQYQGLGLPPSRSLIVKEED